MIPNYKSNVADFNEILEALSSYQSAREILKKIHPIQIQGMVTFRWIPSELRKKLETVQVEGSPIASFFSLTDELGTIWCDRHTELGVLMVYIFHEMVHATDPDLWALSKKSAHPLLKEKAQLKSELKAFRAQQALVREIESKHPGFRAWLKERYPTARVLHEELSESEIVRIYSNPHVNAA